MFFKHTRIAVAGALSWAVQGLLPAHPAVPEWHLPAGLMVQDHGTRTYRFTLDYVTTNTRGEVIHRQRINADYMRGLSQGYVMWRNVTQAEADGATADFGAPRRSEFMEGFRYRNDLGSTLQPEFFRDFPPTAVMERNLVWDTGMIEHFGQDFFAHLHLNEPYHAASGEDVEMPAVGTFHNRDITLEWIGRTRRNGQDCALISYQAFLNPLQILNSGVSLKGRSDYWGQIWVSLATKQIEYATLHENVMGELRIAGQETTQLLGILRSGVFEPVAAK